MLRKTMQSCIISPDRLLERMPHDWRARA
jgi:hypothetical protein